MLLQVLLQIEFRVGPHHLAYLDMTRIVVEVAHVNRTIE